MSFSAPTRERAGAVLPLASMLDVMFLLLIFFMTASVFREQEQAIEVIAPEAETAEQTSAMATPITISVTADNAIYLGTQSHTLESLRAAMLDLFAANPEQAILIRGDEASDLGITVRILDQARAVGLSDVSVATRQVAPE